MKHTFTIPGLILISIMSLNAQIIDLGFKPSIGFANTNFTNIPETDSNSDIFSSTFSYGFNGTLNYKINELLGFSIEPGIIKKGWTSNKGNNKENKIKLYYAQLPGFLDFYLSNNLYLSIGPEIDYLLNAKNKSTSGTDEITHLFRDFEISGITGITYNIFNFYDIGLKYSHGFTKISDELLWIADDNFDEIKLKGFNQSFQFFIKIKIKNLRE